MAEFEIVYTIKRDGEEIGFGAAWSDQLDAALYEVESTIQNRLWETTAGMPDASEVDR